MKACVIGHRPEKFGQPSNYADIQSRLKEEILQLMHSGVETFYSDMRRGVGLWAAELIRELKESHSEIKLVAVLTDEGQPERMDLQERKICNDILSKCDFIESVDKEYLFRTSNQSQRRYWMDQVDIVLAVYNKGKYEKSLTGQSVRMAETFHKNVMIIDPEQLEIKKNRTISKFAENLKRLRKQEGITQEKLGSHLGCSNQRISLFEAEKMEPTQAELIRIAEYFGVTVGYLLGCENGEKNAIPLWLLDWYMSLTDGKKEILHDLVEAFQ